MRVVLQRVKEAKVLIGGEISGSIGHGYVALLGFSDEDDKAVVEKIAEKIKKLRLFEDENGKTNLSIDEVGGDLLAVSQFTLYADCKKGNRPSFTKAAKGESANALYEFFIDCAKSRFKNVEQGVFGADMELCLINDGPFTVILEE